MEELNLILDMTHLADASFWEAANRFKGSVLASHNNCRAIAPGDRQFDDAQIRLIIQRDGVIGAPFDAWMIVPDWQHGMEKQLRPTLDSSIRHIDHICQLAGSARHVAIGSDLDGGYGTEQYPQELDTIADLQKLRPLLQQHGYTENDIEGIFNANWLRFFERAWKGHRLSLPSSVGG
jgi:membrane dipeptidase